MAATRSIRHIMNRSKIKLLTRRGATFDSATRPMNVTTSVPKLKRVSIGTRTRKLMTSRQNFTVG